MRSETKLARRFMSSAGQVVDLDELLADQGRRKLELQAELNRIEARLADLDQRRRRLDTDEPRRYTTPSGMQVDLDQDRSDTKARLKRLETELAHLDGQLEETRRRIMAFDRDPTFGDARD